MQVCVLVSRFKPPDTMYCDKMATLLCIPVWFYWGKHAGNCTSVVLVAINTALWSQSETAFVVNLKIFKCSLQSTAEEYRLCIMALNTVPCHAVVFTLVAAVLGLADASHFRGAVVHWRPVDPVNFDGRVSMPDNVQFFAKQSDEIAKCWCICRMM